MSEKAIEGVCTIDTLPKNVKIIAELDKQAGELITIVIPFLLEVYSKMLLILL